jgi:uroporphyrinogen decarboxylase
MHAPLLVRAARREPVERTPVWFMRQAGRSLPEYRALRERHAFFDIANDPDLCAEVTLQPVRRHKVDAAVMFADIMTPVLAMGVDVQLVEGVGPVIESFDAKELRIPEHIAPALCDAIRIVREELADEQAVVGFCGAPFTVAGYLVEGRPSRDFEKVKAMMANEPAAWHSLMDTLTECSIRYLAEQEEAGADAIQLFDSWVGVLSVEEYDEFVAEYSGRILASVGVPTIHFGTGTSHLLERMRGDVIGVDWRIHLDEAWEIVGDEKGVQGNLDPAALLQPWEQVEAAALDVLERARGRNGHIFNTGHGILPDTDPDTITRLTELVQSRTVEARV